MDFRDIIRQKPYLIWYTKDYDALDEDAVVEAVLNGGEWEDVQKLISLLGIERVAQIFRQQAMRQRGNYQPKVLDYFGRYFDHYARRDSHQ